MKWSSLGATARLWWSLALLALLALAPFLCTLAAALVAFVLRCDLDEGNIFPCLVFGVDLGYPLHFFGIMLSSTTRTSFGIPTVSPLDTAAVSVPSAASPRAART